jgi:hypothetical protein
VRRFAGGGRACRSVSHRADGIAAPTACTGRGDTGRRRPSRQLQLSVGWSSAWVAGRASGERSRRRYGGDRDTPDRVLDRVRGDAKCEALQITWPSWMSSAWAFHVARRASRPPGGTSRWVCRHDGVRTLGDARAQVFDSLSSAWALVRTAAVLEEQQRPLVGVARSARVVQGSRSEPDGCACPSSVTVERYTGDASRW